MEICRKQGGKLSTAVFRYSGNGRSLTLVAISPVGHRNYYQQIARQLRQEGDRRISSVDMPPLPAVARPSKVTNRLQGIQELTSRLAESIHLATWAKEGRQCAAHHNFGQTLAEVENGMNWAQKLMLSRYYNKLQALQAGHCHEHFRNVLHNAMRANNHHNQVVATGRSAWLVERVRALLINTASSGVRHVMAIPLERFVPVAQFVKASGYSLVPGGIAWLDCANIDTVYPRP